MSQTPAPISDSKESAQTPIAATLRSRSKTAKDISHDALNWIIDNAINLGTCVGTLIVSILSFPYASSNIESILLFIGAVSLIFVCQLLGLRQTAKMTLLTKELEFAYNTIDSARAASALMFEPIMRIIYQLCQVSSTGRVSFYVIDDQSFVCIGRWAAQPIYKKPGRKGYPSEQGCIGLAWKNKDRKFFVQDLPDPNNNLEDYKIKCSKKLLLPIDVCEKLSMKSRSYYVRVLDSTSSESAIIVFEDLEPRGLKKNKIDLFLTREVCLMLSGVIERARKYMVNISEYDSLLNKGE